MDFAGKLRYSIFGNLVTVRNYLKAWMVEAINGKAEGLRLDSTAKNQSSNGRKGGFLQATRSRMLFDCSPPKPREISERTTLRRQGAARSRVLKHL